MIEYKGYVGFFTFDEKENIFQGKVSNIQDFITFQGKSVETTKQAFKDAINDYIEWFCTVGAEEFIYWTGIGLIKSESSNSLFFEKAFCIYIHTKDFGVWEIGTPGTQAGSRCAIFAHGGREIWVCGSNANF